MKIESPSFKHESEIPASYTCDSRNISPPINWKEIPAGAKSLVLIVDDPDAPDPAAPKMRWVHWLLYNIPVHIKGLAEGIPISSLPEGTLQGLNDWHKTGYLGPCPPHGRHRYYFRLYALDTHLPNLLKPSRFTIEQAMHGHILAQANLLGYYQRQDMSDFDV